MEKNVGKQDAFVRTVIAAVTILVAWLFVENPLARIILALLSAYIAATAYFHSCPIYRLTKKNTFHSDSPSAEAPPETKAEGGNVSEEKTDSQ